MSVTCEPGIEYAEVTGYRPLELDLYRPDGAAGTASPGASGTAPPGASGTAPPGASGTTPLGASGTTPPGASGTAPPGASGTAPLGASGTAPPGASGTTPTVVHVHGGGWRRGSRRHPLPAAGDGFYRGLAEGGIAVAAVDYRLSGEARYPAALDDVRAAVAWARTALPGYGITPGPLVLWGDSAGGHLALLAALTSAGASGAGVDGAGVYGTGVDGAGVDGAGVDGAGAVDGVVAWFPVTDLLGLPGTAEADPATREALFLGAPPVRVPDLAREASPISHVHAGAPPVLLMHGDRDALVPADQSIRFARALNEAGGTATLELVPGASHFWDGAADVPGLVARSAAFVRSLAPART